ncbi:MAG TPA: four helix bundle protein [Blastocatellia bacterium]
MKVKEDNVVLEKAHKFAQRIVKLYKYLTDEKHEFILSRKLLDDGTDIGGFIKIAQEAESHDMFTRDMSTALRKCSRTDFWLQLLLDGGYLDQTQFDSMDTDNQELFRLLTKIVKSAKGLR